MNKIKRNRYILSIVLFLLAVTLITAVYVIRGKKGISPLESIMAKDLTEGYIIDKYKDGFVTYNGEELIAYGNSINQKWVLVMMEKDAQLYINKEYILLFSKSSGNVYLVNDGKVKCEFASPKKITGGALNENGYICLLTEDKGYKGQCSVYKNNGENLITYSYGEAYILGANLANDNKHLALNLISEQGKSKENKLLFADINTGKTVNEVLFAENIIYTAFKGNNLLVSDKEALYCMSKNGRKKWKYEYGDGEIEYIDFSDRIISLVLKRTGSFGNRELLNLDGGGRVKGQSILGSSVDAFDVSETSAAAYADEKIFLFDKRGREVGMVSAGLNVSDIMLYKNENAIISVTENEISMNKFRR